ncbi:Hypothetical predicted protein [Paramuricea clavata]|uniref:Uncharacterized protein n=1 Tax=Paramuricea clavata TaxID=317549 RepID=A0A6S7J6E3_PARCT|nr:Hypothetical predicted protein [Paramuricea clavata]
MASIALPLTNILLGVSSIGAGIGFSVAEQQKRDDLNAKVKTLKDAVNDTGNLYDHVYYLTTVNLQRLEKSVNMLPSNFLEMVKDDISNAMNPSEFVKDFESAAQVMGWIGAGAGTLSGVIKLIIKVRARKAAKKSSPAEEEAIELDAAGFGRVPLNKETVRVPKNKTTTLPKGRLSKMSLGLDIGGIVFGAAAFLATIGLGTWSIVELNKALAEVENKQTQVDLYKKSMTKMLDIIVKAAGLPEKKYDGLVKMSKMWKQISGNFDGYQKSLYYAIRGYSMKKPYDQVKKMVDKESDEGLPFPKDGYVLAELLAKGIKAMFDEKKTDQEVINYFATENPEIGLRFVFDEFFISTLRWD